MLDEDLPNINWEVDGLSLPCADCGHDVPWDYIVDDEVWQANVPGDLQNDVLCLSCLDDRVDGVPPDAVRIVYWTGKEGTLPLLPGSYVELLETKLREQETWGTPVEPVEADEGFYWSTDLQEPVEVVTEGDRTPWLRVLGRDGIHYAEYLPGHLVPLQEPRREENND